jgi:flagellar motor switch protein FliN/FliY
LQPLIPLGGKRVAEPETEAAKLSGDVEHVDLSLLMDVPLQVTVELGRAQLTMESLLRLNQGSIVELNQVIGEPLAILVNNRLMAHGEAVVVKEKFAVRIVDVVSPERRIETLR